MKNVIIFSDKNSPLLERSGLVRLCRVAEIYPPLEDPAIGAPITRNAQLVTRNPQRAAQNPQLATCNPHPKIP